MVFGLFDARSGCRDLNCQKSAKMYAQTFSGMCCDLTGTTRPRKYESVSPHNPGEAVVTHQLKEEAELPARTEKNQPLWNFARPKQ